MEIRPHLLKRDLRQQLFLLFAGWSGKFGRPFSSGRDENPSEMELTSVGAMVSVLCCGPCFYRESLMEDSNSKIYSWLDTLLSSKNEKVIFFTFYIFTLNSITLTKYVILIEKCRPCKTFTILKFKLITKNCVHSRSTRWPRRRSSCCWNSILK